MYRLWFGRLLWFGRSVKNLSIRSFPTKQARSDAALDGANERVLALIPHSLRSFRNFHFGQETTGSITPIASELTDAVRPIFFGLNAHPTTVQSHTARLLVKKSDLGQMNQLQRRGV